MAIGDPYAALDELKNYLSVPPSKTSLDEALTDALGSATTGVERYCGRQFNKATAATARTYEPSNASTCYVDDFWTTAGLVVETDSNRSGVFDTVWSTADFELWPLNGVVEGQPGWPFRTVKAVANLSFPVLGSRRRAVVRVTAQWGWTAVPEPVRQATLIIAAETYRLKDAPFGVAGLDSFGTIRVRENRMAASKLAPYIRHPLKVR